MPSRIPVRIAEHHFRSINQARGHYCEILHRYQPGQRVSEPDQAAVLELMGCAGVLPGAGDGTQGVRVVRGKFGMACFAARSEERGSQVMSIIRAVRSCVVGVKLKSYDSPTQSSSACS